MIATAKNYDIICFQLRNNLYSQLHNPLKKDLNRLSNEIKSILISGETIKHQSANILSQVFDLRIKALKWLSTNLKFDYIEIFEEVFQKLEELKSIKQLEVLTENINFALRCNKRVVESVMCSNDFSSDSIKSNLNQLPEITFPQFVASLAFANLDDKTTQMIMDWTNASLHIEFVLVAADIIRDEKLVVSDKIVNELAFLIADAAQEYSALATELGIIKTKSSSKSPSTQSFDNNFINEQKHLADLGLDDFVVNMTT